MDLKYKKEKEKQTCVGPNLQPAFPLLSSSPAHCSLTFSPSYGARAVSRSLRRAHHSPRLLSLSPRNAYVWAIFVRTLQPPCAEPVARTLRDWRALYPGVGPLRSVSVGPGSWGYKSLAEAPQGHTHRVPRKTYALWCWDHQVGQPRCHGRENKNALCGSPSNARRRYG